MSRKHVNGEILGRSLFKVVADRLVAVGGGAEVGSAIRKREAKREATRAGRRYGKSVTRTEATT